MGLSHTPNLSSHTPFFKSEKSTYSKPVAAATTSSAPPTFQPLAGQEFAKLQVFISLKGAGTTPLPPIYLSKVQGPSTELASLSCLILAKLSERSAPDWTGITIGRKEGTKKQNPMARKKLFSLFDCHST